MQLVKKPGDHKAPIWLIPSNNWLIGLRTPQYLSSISYKSQSQCELAFSSPTFPYISFHVFPFIGSKPTISVSPYQLRHGTRHQGLHQGLRHGAAVAVAAEVQGAAAPEAVGQVVPGVGVLRIPGTTGDHGGS